jgi:hypothetical protein
MTIGQRLRPPSAQHLLGTDEFGRDLLARIIHGSRISLHVGLISVGIGGLVGTALGMAAGLGSHKVDLAISALVDVMLDYSGRWMTDVLGDPGPGVPRAGYEAWMARTSATEGALAAHHRPSAQRRAGIMWSSTRGRCVQVSVVWPKLV